MNIFSEYFSSQIGDADIIHSNLKPQAIADLLFGVISTPDLSLIHFRLSFVEAVSTSIWTQVVDLFLKDVMAHGQDLLKAEFYIAFGEKWSLFKEAYKQVDLLVSVASQKSSVQFSSRSFQERCCFSQLLRDRLDVPALASLCIYKPDFIVGLQTSEEFDHTHLNPVSESDSLLSSEELYALDSSLQDVSKQQSFLRFWQLWQFRQLSLVASVLLLVSFTAAALMNILASSSLTSTQALNPLFGMAKKEALDLGLFDLELGTEQSVNRPRALLSLAELYMKAGDHAKAHELSLKILLDLQQCQTCERKEFYLQWAKQMEKDAIR